MKRILVVGANVLNVENAAGITLRSVFDHIAPQDLMGLAWGDVSDCSGQAHFRIHRLYYKNLSLGRFLDNAWLKKASRRIKRAEKPYAAHSHKEVNRIHSKVFQIVEYLREWIALAPSRAIVKISAEDMDEIKKFSPEVIYTVGESISALDLSYRLSRIMDIPIVIHFMDNWRNSIEWAENPLLKNYQRRLAAKCNLCYKRSTTCIAVSQGMADAYTKETGVGHSVIMNSIDTGVFHLPPKERTDEVQFVYAGGLHLGRNVALRVIGEQIERICKETGAKVSFSIYTSRENINLFGGDFAALQHTNVYDAVPHDEIMRVYSQADVLIHAESGVQKNNDFFKYSVSTKISEYLSSGRTVMFFGPSNIYLYDFLKDNELAYTAENANEAECLLRMFIEGGYESRIDKAYHYAKEHFDINVAVKAFCDTIDNVTIPR